MKMDNSTVNGQGQGWKVWRTIRAGGRSIQVLDSELKAKGIYYHKYARKMILSQGFSTLQQPEMIDLVRLKVSDLDFTAPPNIDLLHQKALDSGLHLCPPEVGPELRLEYTDQPLGERLYLGMRHIDLPDEDYFNQPDPYIFVVERDKFDKGLNGIMLIGLFASSGLNWQLDKQFIFCLR